VLHLRRELSESSPKATENAPQKNWIPACAGMTGVSKGIRFQMTPLPNGNREHVAVFLLILKNIPASFVILSFFRGAVSSAAGPFSGGIRQLIHRTIESFEEKQCRNGTMTLAAARPNHSIHSERG
jgi:hypothetical protein